MSSVQTAPGPSQMGQAWSPGSPQSPWTCPSLAPGAAGQNQPFLGHFYPPAPTQPAHVPPAKLGSPQEGAVTISPQHDTSFFLWPGAAEQADPLPVTTEPHTLSGDGHSALTVGTQGLWALESPTFSWCWAPHPTLYPETPRALRGLPSVHWCPLAVPPGIPLFLTTLLHPIVHSTQTL